MSLAKKFLAAVVLLAAIGGAGFWFLTEPRRLDEAKLAELGTGDAVRGERIFWAGGCASCHARPKAEGPAQLELAGGVELKTPFGTFVAPNISQDPNDGIGAWSAADLGQCDDEGRCARRLASLPGLPLRVLRPDEAVRRRRPLRLSEDAAGGGGQGAAASARLSHSTFGAASACGS